MAETLSENALDIILNGFNPQAAIRAGQPLLDLRKSRAQAKSERKLAADLQIQDMQKELALNNPTLVFALQHELSLVVKSQFR